MTDTRADAPLPTDPLTVQELASLQDAGTPHLLIDVREPVELAHCSLPGAAAIPMRAIPDHMDQLPQDRPLIVMCHHGMRSQQVVDYLRHHGFSNAVNLTGGIDAWSREIDPTVPRY